MWVKKYSIWKIYDLSLCIKFYQRWCWKVLSQTKKLFSKNIRFGHLLRFWDENHANNLSTYPCIHLWKKYFIKTCGNFKLVKPFLFNFMKSESKIFLSLNPHENQIISNFIWHFNQKCRTYAMDLKIKIGGCWFNV